MIGNDMPYRAYILIALLLGLALFITLPALLASVRQHPERRLIYKLTPLALFSFLLWLVLIAWAWTGKRNDAVLSRYVVKLRDNNRLPLMVALLVVLGLAGSLLTLLR
jgi:membrane protease YdiL (CAAX protease family)